MEENAKPLSTENYKGVRDFYPEDMAVEKYMFDTMRKVVESFGYIEYGASVLEPAELYKAKSSEEIVRDQTYTFTDRGEREVTLRPEMTPTLARMIAAKRRELSFPLRWYSVPNLFRYERPQRGRLREHFQLNVDIFGVSGIAAEIELICLASEILQALKLPREAFEIRLNSRKQINAHIQSLGLSEENSRFLFTLLDKKEKIENFDEEVLKIVGKPVSFDIEPGEEVKNLMEALKGLGLSNVRFVPTLVRGFDYYTDIVFEIFDTDEKNRRAILGGGRYDNLLEIFGEEPVPAAGFGIGDVTLRDALEAHNVLPEIKSITHVALCPIDDASVHEAMNVARVLRGEGLNVSVEVSGKKVGDQIKKADKDKIPFIVCVGEKEKANNAFEVKELLSGTTETMPLESIAPFISSKLS